MADILEVYDIKNNTTEDIGDKKSRANVAAAFNTSKTYAINDLTVYNGELYKFTTAHSVGAWDINHVTKTTIDNEFVKKTGDTITGSLVINNGTNYKGIHINGDNNAPILSILNTGARFTFDQRVKESTGSERYLLPAVDSQSSDKWYKILTSKNVVAISEGGTGASTTTEFFNNFFSGDTSKSALSNITLNSNVVDTSSNSNTITIKRFGNIVALNGTLAIKSNLNLTWQQVQLFTLKVFLPETATSNIMISTMEDPRKLIGFWYVNTDGTVKAFNRGVNFSGLTIYFDGYYIL